MLRGVNGHAIYPLNHPFMRFPLGHSYGVEGAIMNEAFIDAATWATVVENGLNEDMENLGYAILHNNHEARRSLRLALIAYEQAFYFAPMPNYVQS